VLGLRLGGGDVAEKDWHRCLRHCEIGLVDKGQTSSGVFGSARLR
jgi:hypothetical protein